MDGAAFPARVRAAYLHAPAVEIVHRYNGEFVLSYTFLLRAGTITAELVHARNSVGNIVMAHENGHAYDFDPEKRCWKLDPLYWRTENEIGKRFPDIALRQVRTARRVGSVWQLPVVGFGQTDTMVIDAKTFLVKKFVAGDSPHDVQIYSTLTRAPTFPTARPLCRK